MRKYVDNLQGISNKSAADYTLYKKLYRLTEKQKDGLEQSIDKIAASLNNDEHSANVRRHHVQKLAELAFELEEVKKHPQAEAVAKKSGEHLRDYMGEYHDVALIDAYMNGKTITVAQPLEIGQKVEVQKPEQ